MYNMRSGFNKSVALDNETIQKLAPSVFVEQASDKVSDKYLFIPTIQVVNQIKSQGFEVVHASQSRSKTQDGRAFAKHLLRFRKTEFLNKQILNVEDSVTELVLVNSHDGSSSFQLSLGLFRLVCSNGLIASSNIAAESVRHSGYEDSKIIDAQYKVLGNETKLIESVQRMTSVELSQEERMALATSALDLRYDSEDTKPDASKLLTVRRYEDNKKDLWSTFNTIQENVIKGGLRTYSQKENGRTSRNRTRAVNSVSENKRLNQALWTLAESMATLKGA